VIPVAPPSSRAPLGPGDQACCLLLEVAGRRSRSGTRQTVCGVARVRVESVEGELFHVVVVAARSWEVGKRLSYKRGELYALEGDERRAFRDLVEFFWGRNG
jgi:hypothetical protein